MLFYSPTPIKVLLRSAALMACAFVLPATVHGADDAPNYYLPKPDCEYLTEAAKQEDLHGRIKYMASQGWLTLDPRYNAVPEMKQFCEEFLQDVLVWEGIKIVEPVQRAATLKDATFVRDLEAQCPDLEISTATYGVQNIHTWGFDPFHVRFLLNYKLYDLGTDEAGDKIVAMYMDYQKPYQNNMNNFDSGYGDPHMSRYLVVKPSECQILGTYEQQAQLCTTIYTNKVIPTISTALNYKGRGFILQAYSNGAFLKATRPFEAELSQRLKIGPNANTTCLFSRSFISKGK